jgi:hypothetical protein
MTDDLSPLQQDIILLCWWAFWMVIFLFVIWLASLPASGLSLQISGHVSGHGYQNLSYVGDTLNVSILQNGTGWNFTLVGGAA